MTNSDEPINPVPAQDMQYTGLTKREHLAAMAMQGMLSSRYVGDFGVEINDKSYDQVHGLANNAIRYADALLSELDK